MRVKAGCAKEAEIRIEGIYWTEEGKQKVSYGDEGKVTVIPSLEENSPHRILVGLGKEEELTCNRLRNIAAKAAKAAQAFDAKQAAVHFPIPAGFDAKEFCIAVTEGMTLTDFVFDQYKTEKAEKKEQIFYLEMAGEEELPVIRQACELTAAMNRVRALVLEPCSSLYPETLAEWVEKAGTEYGFETQVLDEADIQREGMEALWAVGRGSARKPRLIILRYMGNPGGEIYGLVGKGITCDTGGYCLKNRDSLPYIKGDMAGAAYVIGTICALAANGCRVNAVGVVPSAENRISDDSYMPGDVVKTFAGKTVEVMDTDCEGRMVLADALTYAVRREHTDKLLDMATLTGLAGSTFGSLYTPLFCSDEAYCEQFLAAAGKAGEDFWRMPLDARYRDYLKSDVADLANKAGAGTITAAKFLQEFTDQVPWIHLDIAATAAQYPPVFAYAENMPSGVAIRTIYEMLGGYQKERGQD